MAVQFCLQLGQVTNHGFKQMLTVKQRYYSMLTTMPCTLITLVNREVCAFSRCDDYASIVINYIFWLLNILYRIKQCANFQPQLHAVHHHVISFRERNSFLTVSVLW